jgi:hypothetical protein
LPTLALPTPEGFIANAEDPGISRRACHSTLDEGVGGNLYTGGQNIGCYFGDDMRSTWTTTRLAVADWVSVQMCSISPRTRDSEISRRPRQVRSLYFHNHGSSMAPAVCQGNARLCSVNYSSASVTAICTPCCSSPRRRVGSKSVPGENRQISFIDWKVHRATQRKLTSMYARIVS